MNLYAYVGNDPVNVSDPTGKAGECDTGTRIEGVGSGFCKVAEGYEIEESSPRLLHRANVSTQGGWSTRFAVNLAEEEARGGHTIRFHVKKSYSFLVNRVNSNRVRGLFVTVGLKRAGSFTSLKAATRLTNATLSANSHIVRRVSSGQQKVARIDRRFSSPTGYEAYTTGRSSPQIRETYGVTVWIVHNPTVTEGFRVHTAYPSNQD